MPPDAIALRVGGTAHTGWKEVSVVRSIEGEPVASSRGLIRRLALYEPGARVSVEYADAEGELRSTDVVLHDEPSRVTRLTIPILAKYSYDIDHDRVSFTLADLWILSLFRYEREEIITAVTTTSGGQQSRNSGTASGHGLELEAEWLVNERLKLSGNYAYQRAEDDASGSDSGNSPHHQLYLSTDWRLTPGWRLHGRLNRVADRERPPGDPRPAIDDYTTVDLGVRFEAKRWEAALTVRNLFDERALEPSVTPTIADFPLPGRAFFVETRFQF